MSTHDVFLTDTAFFPVTGKRVSAVLFCCLISFCLAVAIRLLEWPSWQHPEYKLGNEMLLATHDAYHWVAGASGFGRAAGHPMAELLRLINFCGEWQLANIAFWLPAVMAGLVAAAVCLWCALLGSAVAGIGAGLMVSIAPGFLGRTLLGYYDTDIVTLFFPLCMAFCPAWFIKSAFSSKIKFSPEANGVFLFWRLLLALAGTIAWTMAEWHSVFPYLIRCDVAILFIFCLFAGKARDVQSLLLTACTYAFPALAGWWGLAFVILCILIPCLVKREALLHKTPILIIICLSVAALALRGDIFNQVLHHANVYLKNSGDLHSSGAAALVYPSVAQSIIEVQDLSFFALFPYFHPWLEAALWGVFAYFYVCWRKPAALFLIPLLFLGLSSARLGGRMVMFGSPVTALGLTLSLFWIMLLLFRKVKMEKMAPVMTCLLICALFVAPFLYVVPALSQGPILNRRHAAALSQLGKITPENAMIWLWWDWGYAAQYFGRRQTICDGAKHGGPSLYLPAAVFATDNPRFARQIIRRTAEVGNEPGNFFKDMGPLQAQNYIESLRSRQTPLLSGNTPQYLIVSFEMLKLGFWISYYGSWNFIGKNGESGAISIVPQALSYNLELGEVRLDGNKTPIFPISINVFEESGITSRDYLREWLNNHPGANEIQRMAWLGGRRNINFLFNRVTDEKLAMGEGIYNSLMTQLLLAEPGDPRFAPYFKLVYDNIFTRIYQVLGSE